VTLSTKQEAELAPCGFCGSQKVEHLSYGATAICIQCTDCGAHGPVMETIGGAEYGWNRRAAQPEPVEATGGAAAEHQYRTRADWHKIWSDWERCTEASYNDYVRVPLLHDWHYEVRKLYTRSEPAPAPVASEPAPSALRLIQDEDFAITGPALAMGETQGQAEHAQIDPIAETLMRAGHTKAEAIELAAVGRANVEAEEAQPASVCTRNCPIDTPYGPATCGKCLGVDEPASAPVTPFAERMTKHYEGGSVQMLPASYFMQQEIGDWRARASAPGVAT